MSHVLIIVPLHEEMVYAYGHLKDMGAEVVEPYDRSRGRCQLRYTRRSREVIRLQFVVIGDMGNLTTAVSVAPLLVNHHPNMVFLTGICGTLNQARLALGDVLIAHSARMLYPDKIKQLDPDKEVFRSEAAGDTDARIKIDDRKKFMAQSFFRFRRDAVEVNGSDKLYDYMDYLQRGRMPDLRPITSVTIPGLEPLLENERPKVVGGDIIGSDFVFDSADYLKFLDERNGNEEDDYYTQKEKTVEHPRRKWWNSELLGVDMETFGFFRMYNIASKMENVPPLTTAFSVRGVSDFSSEKGLLEGETKNEVRRFAVRNAINVVLDIIEFFSPRSR